MKNKVVLLFILLICGIGATGWGCIKENTWNLPGSDAKHAPVQESKMRYDPFSERWINTARASAGKDYYLDIPTGLWYYEQRNERNEKIKIYVSPDAPATKHPAPVLPLVVEAIALPTITTNALTGEVMPVR